MMGYMSRTRMYECMHEAAAKKAQMAREKQEKVMPHTQQTYIIPEDVCACVCMCVCVFVTARFSQVAKQEERLHEEGRVSLAPSLGQVSTIVSALDVCMNVLYGSVYACMHGSSQNYTQVSVKFSRSSRKESSRKMSDISTGEMATDPGKEKKVRVICVTDRKIFRLTLRPSRTGRALT